MDDEPALEPVPSGRSLGARFEHLYARVARFIPWLSLGLSIAGAVAVDHSETRGPWVAAAAALSWVVLVLVSVAHRPHDAATTGALLKLARFATTSASQSLLQLSLFFCAPFYFEASTWTLPQWAFGTVFVAVTALTLWDPLCARVLLHAMGGPFLMAFASFVSWNAALPMLGVAQKTSVWLAAGTVALALPITRLMQGARGKRLLGTLLSAVLLPTLLFIGGIRAIPPAPLRVMHAAIGTRIVERELVDPTRHFARAPAAVLCFTAIRAPSTLYDTLEHVWTLDGKVVLRIPLKLHGGRRRGFRTWSRLRLSSRAEGLLRCEVQNSLGQTLGGTSTSIGTSQRSKPR